MKTNPKLIKGNTIALCATARFVEQNIIDQAKKLLKDSGFKVFMASNLTVKHHQMAGDDNTRAHAFQALLSNPEIKAIWCLRGGFGGLRIIDKLDFKALLDHPKLLIGFSDFTSILNHAVNMGVPVIHGPMPIQLSKLTTKAKNSLFSILHGEEVSYEWPQNTSNQLGKSKGKIVGGNLSVLYSLIGSTSFPKLEGAILFIEDIDEYVYHIDRMILAMKRAGAFKGLKGVVVGSFTDLHDHEIPFGQNYQEVLLEYFGDRDIPIAFEFPAGHQDDNRCLILGETVTLDVQATHSSLK